MALAASVRGPVDFWALARLAVSLASEMAGLGSDAVVDSSMDESSSGQRVRVMTGVGSDRAMGVFAMAGLGF